MEAKRTRPLTMRPFGHSWCAHAAMNQSKHLDPWCCDWCNRGHQILLLCELAQEIQKENSYFVCYHKGNDLKRALIHMSLQLSWESYLPPAACQLWV